MEHNTRTMDNGFDENSVCLDAGSPKEVRNSKLDISTRRLTDPTRLKADKGVKRAPTVAGAKVKFEKYKTIDLDLICRDPDGLNRHCMVKFEDIIAEPDPTVFSFDGVWTLSYKVFTSTKLWCYRITSLICAIPAAVCWGIEFACLSFCTIWCWQPSLKAYEISLWYTRRVFEIFLAVFFEPCFHAMGKCLSHIVVTVKREG